jgi:hypothetical protein
MTHFTFKYGFGFFLVLFWFSCGQQETSLQPGIVLTFDDNALEEWEAARPLFERYGVKATFYVSGIHKMNSGQIAKLRSLQQDGHEIACHGLNHISVTEFIDQGYTVEEYLVQEVLPAQRMLQDYGFSAKNFAYPHGHTVKGANELLWKYFNSVRFAASKDGQNITDVEETFISDFGKKMLVGMGLDNWENLTLAEIKSALYRAEKKEEVVVFYGHIPSSSTTKPYHVNLNFLDSLFAIAQEMGLQYYTVQEVANKQNQ